MSWSPTGLNSRFCVLYTTKASPLTHDQRLLLLLRPVVILHLAFPHRLPNRSAHWTLDGNLVHARIPRWLIKVGREEEGRYILGRLRGEGGADEGRAEAEFQDIRNIVELERKTSKQSSYFSMFFGIGSGKLHTGRRVQLVVWLQILQEWIGIAGITIYGPTIFTIAGISARDRLWVAGLNDITYMVRSTRLCIAKWDQLTTAVRHSIVRLHPRPNRPTMDSLLGLRRSRHLYVLRWWTCPRYTKRCGGE